MIYFRIKYFGSEHQTTKVRLAGFQKRSKSQFEIFHEKINLFQKLIQEIKK